MASELTVQTIRGPSSGANANKILLGSGQQIIAPAGGLVAPGQVIQVQHYKNNTATTLSGMQTYSLWSGMTFNKKMSNSKLLLLGQLVFRDGQSYFMGEYWRVGGSGYRYDGVIQHGYASDAGDTSVQFGWTINAEYITSEVGNLAVDIGWNANAAGGNMPAMTWNPGTGQDSRISGGAKYSTLTIMEIAQ